MTRTQSDSAAGLRSPRVWAIVLLGMLAVFQFARIAQPANRTHGLMWDFSVVYSASRAMLAGQDPFQRDNLYGVWDAQPHWKILPPADRSALGIWISVNPPPTLLLIAPLAALGSSAAHAIWIGCDIVLMALMIAALWQLAGLESASDRLLLVTGMLASAPVVTILRTGQLGFPACAGVVLAVWAVARGRPILAGVLLGLATALKFQVAGPFILFYLLMRRWHVALVATGLFAAISLAGITVLEMHHVPWLTEWKANMAQSLAPGALNDPRPGAPGRDNKINLQSALYGLTSSDRTVTAATAICCAVLASAFLLGVRRFGPASMTESPQRPACRPDDLLALSCVALLSCLPAYRRLYDLTILTMLLAWAIAALSTPRRRWAIVTLALLAEFLFPTDILLEHLPNLTARLATTTCWQAIIIPRHAWTLLLLTAWTTTMSFALAKRTAASPPFMRHPSRPRFNAPARQTHRPSPRIPSVIAPTASEFRGDSASTDSKPNGHRMA